MLARTMRWLLLAAMLLATNAEAAALVKERIPMALHLIGPEADDAARELVRDRADATIRVRTRMSVVPVEALAISRARLDACGASTALACWVAAVRPQLEPPPGAPPFLMVVTLHSGERARIAVLVIDLDRAVRARDDEALMFQDAVHSDFAELDTFDASNLDAFFAKLFDAKLRPVLEAAGHWRENGSVEIDTLQAGLTIGIDGEAAGTTSSGRTIVDGVPIGERTIALSDPNGLVEHDPVALRVERGRAARLVPALSSGPSAIPAIRAITLWTGVATSAAAVALGIYAFTAPQNGHDLRVCPGGECPDAERKFATFTGDPGGAPIAPVAFGLLGAGIGWSLGTLFFGEAHELPWIAWLAGAGLGGAALAATWIAN